jgi:hypothetical protein
MILLMALPPPPPTPITCNKQLLAQHVLQLFCFWLCFGLHGPSDALDVMSN